MRTLLSGITALALVGLTASSAAAATVVVTESDLSAGSTVVVGDGSIAVTDEFGRGALALSTPSDAAKVQWWTPGMSVDLAGVGDIAYDTYRSSQSTSTAGVAPAINLAIDANGGTLDDGGFATLVYEPIDQAGGAGAVADDTWQTWDADAGVWWSTRAIGGLEVRVRYTLDEIVAANPDAVLLAAGINQGSFNAGTIAGADMLTVAGTTYDVEPRAYGVPDCKDGGWTDASGHGQEFRNQGDCVSFYASGGASHG